MFGNCCWRRTWPVGLAILLCQVTLGAEPAALAGPLFSAEIVRADFDELYERMRASHYDLYARRPQVELDRLHAAMRASLNEPLDATQVATRFQRFLAFGAIAHARIDFPREAFERWRQSGGRLFPLAVRVVDGRTHVTANWSGESRIAPGDEILSVGALPAAKWLEQLTAQLSADNSYMANTMLEFSLQRLVWLDSGGPVSMEMRLQRAGRRPFAVALPLRTNAEIAAERERSAQPFELSWEAREYRMLGDGLAYLRPGPFYDADPDAASPWDPREFSDFIDRAFRSFAAARATALLIDLRDNPGGDSSFSDLMLNWFATRPYRFASSFRIKVSEAAVAANRRRIEAAGDRPDATSLKFAAAYAGRRVGEIIDFEIPMSQPRMDERFAGRVFVLINRHSYSNTVMVAATVQDYGFGTVLGEETSDLASTYGAMEEFELTRTKVKVGFPKARIVRPNGDIAARGVIPDETIRTPIVPTTQDVVLQEAERLIRRR